MRRAAFAAIEAALAARLENTRLQDQIETLGKNLAALDWDKMLAEVEDTSSGATASGSVERQIDRLVIAADGLLSGGLMPDGVSVVTNDAGKLALANIPDKLAVPEVFPFWNGEGLGWTAMADLLDDKSLSVEAKTGAPKDADGDVLIDVSGTIEAHYSEVFDEPWQYVSKERGDGYTIKFQFTRPRGARHAGIGRASRNRSRKGEMGNGKSLD